MNTIDNIGYPFKRMLLLLAFPLLINACVAPEELVNFNTGVGWESLEKTSFISPDILIQTDDILQIAVHTIDAEASAPFSLGGVSIKENSIGNSSSEGYEYLVDGNGNISFPILGNVQLLGLSSSEAKDSIVSKLETYIKNPIVKVRIKNFKISVLGEVLKTGVFPIAEEKITILEAISLAGDLTLYANRTNILIIREREGERSFGRVNLRDRDIFNSPYFYLQQNDIIYVEPIKQKTAAIRNQASKILPWASVLVSLASLTATLISLTR